MRIVSFSYEEHYHWIYSWLEARKMNPELAYDLPKLGFIAYCNDYDAIAAGFLRKVEGNYALLDSLITNPTLPGKDRSHAIDLVVDQLLKAGKEAGFKQIVAFSRDENTLVRSVKHGFMKQLDTVIIKDLS